jgi:phosphatidylinositol alpha-1,6-mannosyltransferase
MENIGGMQRVAMKLHESLELRDAESAGLDYDAVLLRSSWTWTHVKVVPFLLWAAWMIATNARRHDVDVVLFSSMVTAALAVPLRPLLDRYNVRTAAIVHGLDVTTPFPPYQWFVPKVFDALDLVLPVSRATGEACTRRGLPERKVQVVPNGIDPDRFRAPSDRATRRRLLTDALGPLPDDALLLCSVGRQVERKGFEWFIRHVMPDLPDNVYYWLAGDGPQSESINAAIREKGLGERVRLLGRVSDVNLALLYRGADLFVMPNVPVAGDMEGFGVVMLEAGQCGTPAIASRLEGIRDVITDGINGHLVQPESPTAFAQTILRYHDTPRELADFSERARVHTQATFGWPAVAEQYVQVLRGLMDGQR